MRETLSEALFTVRLNPRPSYYSGRGATFTDKDTNATDWEAV